MELEDTISRGQHAGYNTWDKPGMLSAMLTKWAIEFTPTVVKKELEEELKMHCQTRRCQFVRD